MRPVHLILQLALAMFLLAVCFAAREKGPWPTFVWWLFYGSIFLAFCVWLCCGSNRRRRPGPE